MPRFKPLTFTNIIIAITILMFIVQNSIQNGGIIFGLNIYFIKADAWWQPLSTMFVHGGFAHLAMNMIVLFQFGNLLEYYKGWQKLLLIYFVGGIITSLLSFAFMYSTGLMANLVGASGAICAILGYVALYDRFNRNGIIVWVILISFAPLLFGLPIAWYAHLIGFVIGWIMGYVF